MQVKYLAVKTEKVNVLNPYYTSNVSNLEQEYIEQYKSSVIHIYSEKGLQNYILDFHKDKTLKDWAFYSVKEINPTVNVTMDVKLS